MPESASIAQLVQAVGVPVAICLAMLYAFGRWIIRQDDRAERREEAHRAERLADREAHMAALERQGERLSANTEALNVVGAQVRDNGKMLEDVLDDTRRVANGRRG